MCALLASCAHSPPTTSVGEGHCIEVVALGEAGASVVRETGAPAFVKGAAPVARFHVSSHPQRAIETLTVADCRTSGWCDADGRFRIEDAGLRPASSWELARTPAPGTHVVDMPGVGAKKLSWEQRDNRFGEREWMLLLEHGTNGDDPWVLGRTAASFAPTELRWMRAGDALWVQAMGEGSGVRCIAHRVDLRSTAASVLNDDAVKLLRREMLAEARALLEKAVEVAPDDATAAYNLACALSLAKDEDGALGWLDRAVRLDPDRRLAELALTDPDLELIRSRPEFGLIVGQRRAP